MSSDRVLLAALLIALGWLSQACGSADPCEPKGQRLRSLVAVGDTGRIRWPASLFEGQYAVAKGIMAQDDQAPFHAMVLLGDNFYPNGLLRSELNERVRLNVVNPYCRFIDPGGPRYGELGARCRTAAPGEGIPIFAVLGNHDWMAEESPELQRRVLPQYVANWHMPTGMGSVHELGRGLSLILINSAEVRTKGRQKELKALFQSAKGPWRVVAMHVPMASSRLGEAPLEDPPKGSRDWLMRRAVSRSRVPVHLAMTGDDHSLQILETDRFGPRAHLIAGSGSRVRSPHPPNPYRRFLAERPGFARVDLMARGKRRQWLAVSLYATPSLPALTWGAPELLGRWEIGPKGRIQRIDLDSCRPAKLDGSGPSEP